MNNKKTQKDTKFVWMRNIFLQLFEISLFSVELQLILNFRDFESFVKV